jgi:hypothetical protein
MQAIAPSVVQAASKRAASPPPLLEFSHRAASHRTQTIMDITNQTAARQWVTMQEVNHEYGIVDGTSQQCPDGVLNPWLATRRAWEILVVMLVLTDSMILPFQLAYKSHTEKDLFDRCWLWIMTAFFATDILLNFCTGYAAGREDPDLKRGTLITNRCRIAAYYIRHWFLLDLITTIPWWLIADVLEEFRDEWSWAAGAVWSVTKYIRLLRVLRMLRLAKMYKIWDDLEQSLSSFAFLQVAAVFRVLLTILCICHWNACLWWMVGQPKSFLGDFASTEYREYYEALPHWTTVERINSPGDPTWKWIDKHSSDAYVFCFYWTLGVMRTMPTEVMPVNIQERLYVMVFMFLAFSLFAITVAQITQMFFKISERSRGFNEELLAVRSHLRDLSAPTELREDIISFLRHLFDQRHMYSKEKAMLNMLPDHLKDELKYTQVGHHLKNVNLLHHLPDKSLHLISDIAEMRSMARGTILSNRDAIAEGAWILVAGHLQRFPASCETDVKVVDEDCLRDADPVKSPFTTVSIICSEVLWIDKLVFFALMKEEPVLSVDYARATELAAEDDEPPATPLLGGSGSGRKPSKSLPNARLF